MKKIYSLVAGLLLTASVWAQAPQKMSYQAVIRGSSNALITSTPVGMRISILQGSIFGASVYVETQTPSTNANGLVSLEIGTGTPVIGTFAGINWAAGPYFIKTETDPKGGTAYTIVGTNELMSVPYAFFSKEAAKFRGFNVDTSAPSNGQILRYDGTRWRAGGDSIPASFAGAGILISGNMIIALDTSSSNELQAISLSNDTIYLSNGGNVKLPVSTAYWNIAGNTGTSAATNFIGTKDNVAINFRVNNQIAGKIDSTNGSTFLGYGSGKNTSGINNTFIGFKSGNSNTTGNSNTANGIYSLFANTTGYHNVANGWASLYSNSIGNGNVANGVEALFTNASGSYNVATGYQSLFSNTTGYYNVANGPQSLFSNTTGYYNVANGIAALFANTIGNYNIANGAEALYENTSGSNNTAVGRSAGAKNTTGTLNTFIGNGATSSSGSYSNVTALGNGASAPASNRIVLGNTSVGGLYCNVTSITAISDGRVKENVQQDIPGLDFITKLRPVSYNLNIHKQNAFAGIAETPDWDGKYDIEKMRFSGLIAQEVDSIMQATGAKFTGLDKPTENDPLYHMRYGDLIIPMVKAMQEQQELIKTQQANHVTQQQIISNQQAAIEELQKQVALLLALPKPAITK